MPIVQPDVGFHTGEERMHALFNLPPRENPSSSFLTPGAGYFLMSTPLLSLGTVDDSGNPWTTVWGGEPGFARPIGKNIIGIKSLVDRQYDPFVQTLFPSDGIVQAEGRGKMVGGLAIDLAERMRVKLYGRMVAGAVNPGEEGTVGEAQLVVRIEESLGNCPKYLNKKDIHPAVPSPGLVSDSVHLPAEALSLIEKADLFFISSAHGTEDMDTNHRGGPRGFVRVLSNSEEGSVLVYPEYSGNRLYQTLGNLQTNPRAGITFPDFDTGDVLYLTGTTEILAKGAAAAVLPHSNLAVRFTVTSARYISKGLPFTGSAGEMSPYNPIVRYLPSEKEVIQATNTATNSAQLMKKEKLTPTINRYTFRADKPISWKPGQHVAMSFQEELDVGYSHMRDDDPQSLNDDYVRTWTVSSLPKDDSPEFEVTVRTIGAVTTFLSRQSPAHQLDIPLLGFSGSFTLPSEGTVNFIAGGIGITPLLPQLSSVDMSQLTLFWVINVADIGLVVDTFRRWPALASATRLFLTGNLSDDENVSEVQKVCHVVKRRMQKDDLDGVDGEWYLCAGAGLKAAVLNWLAGKRVIYEDFSY